MISTNAICRLVTLIFCVTIVKAQERPFLFTLVPPEAASRPIILHYDAAYGRETFEPLGGDNVEQTLGIQTCMNESITLMGQFSFATDRVSTLSSQHVELLVRGLKSQNGIVDFSAGPGFRHEYGGTNVLLGRAVVGRRFSTWQIYGNFLLEKPFSEQRDELDLFLTTGWSYNVSPSLQLGFEAVGQDLEGFWDENEAEGGATLFIGPIVAAAIPTTPWTFTAGAGPIIRATQTSRASYAPRDLGPVRENGFVIRATINFAL